MAPPPWVQQDWTAFARWVRSGKNYDEVTLAPNRPGELLGSGASRVVFKTPYGALKIAWDEYAAEDNLTEWKNWIARSDYECFVPVLAHERDGLWLLMALAEREDHHEWNVQRLPKYKKCYSRAIDLGLRDLQTGNFAPDGRLLDYVRNPAPAPALPTSSPLAAVWAKLRARAEKLHPRYLKGLKIRRCKEADEEHRKSSRQFMHVGHHDGTVCYAWAAEGLPDTYKVGILAHELGHLLAFALDLKHTEPEADAIAYAATGIRVSRRGAFNLEWSKVPWTRGKTKSKTRSNRSARALTTRSKTSVRSS